MSPGGSRPESSGATAWCTPTGSSSASRHFISTRCSPRSPILSAASQRMQFTALKYQIEQMRRHPSIVGYVITEFTDVHWESNGLLDMCRNPEDLLRCHRAGEQSRRHRADRLGADRVLGRRALRGAAGALALLLQRSPGLPAGVAAGPVAGDQRRIREYHARAGPAHQPGHRGVRGAPRGAAVRARLEMRLLSAVGRAGHPEPSRAATSSLGWAAQSRRSSVSAPGLPATRRPARDMGYELTDDLSADLVVVETMTDELRWYAQNGGKVLWLAESPESQQAHLGAISIAQRDGRSWQGDWASSMSWIRQDKIFGGIPTGGTVDFAFADLTPEDGHRGPQPRDFAANVHSGLFVGWAHHIVALVAERPIDRGRLMICTYRLREHLGTHPVATIMMRDMIARMTNVAAAEPARMAHLGGVPVQGLSGHPSPRLA